MFNNTMELNCRSSLWDPWSHNRWLIWFLLTCLPFSDFILSCWFVVLFYCTRLFPWPNAATQFSHKRSDFGGVGVSVLLVMDLNLHLCLFLYRFLYSQNSSLIELLKNSTVLHVNGVYVCAHYVLFSPLILQIGSLLKKLFWWCQWEKGNEWRWKWQFIVWLGNRIRPECYGE